LASFFSSKVGALCSQWPTPGAAVNMHNELFLPQ
jgi:hypothetical protein